MYFAKSSTFPNATEFREATITLIAGELNKAEQVFDSVVFDVSRFSKFTAKVSERAEQSGGGGTTNQFHARSAPLRSGGQS